MSNTTSNVIYMMKASLGETDIPRRGGKEWLGIFMGESSLDPNYELDCDVKTSYYQNTRQVCRQKNLLTLESNLKTMQMYDSVLKFNGKLKLTSNQAEITEMDKVEFFYAWTKKSTPMDCNHSFI